MEPSKERKHDVSSLLALPKFQEGGKHGIVIDLRAVNVFFQENRDACDVLNEAVSCATIAQGKSEYAYRCGCGSMFKDAGFLEQHALKFHFEQLTFDIDKFLINYQEGFPEVWRKKLLESSWMPINVKAAALISNGMPDWDSLLESDEERMSTLREISLLFQNLFRMKVLHINHVMEMIKYAIREVECLPVAKQLEKFGIGLHSTLWFRCLDASSLIHVRNFLRKLHNECCTKAYDDGDSTFLDGPVEKSADSVILQFPNLKIFTHSEDSDKGDENSILSWLYDAPPLDEVVRHWIQSKEVKRKRVPNILESIYTKLKKVKALRVNQDILSRYIGHLEDLKKVYENERKTEETAGSKSFYAALEEWSQLLAVAEHSTKGARLCKNAINTILEVSKVIKVPRESHFGTPRDVRISNDFIVDTLSKLKWKLKMELHLNTGQIQKKLDGYRQLQKRLENVSAANYLTVIMGIMKNAGKVGREGTGGKLSKRFQVQISRSRNNCL